MKLFKLTALSIVVLLLFSCSDKNQPTDIVVDSSIMYIYQAKILENPSSGKYEYWVRDRSLTGWRLVSDKAYNVGDRLIIQKAE